MRDTFEKHLLGWVGKFKEVKGRRDFWVGQLKRYGGFLGRGLGKGRERVVGERGLKEISLERVRVGGALAWGNACRTRWFLNRFGWIRTRV